MNYLFTIIIPVYNSEKFLSESIESILSQNHSSTEILLINDFSSDNSGKICRYYSLKYPFITYVNRSKNYGVGISRNIGIQKAKGKYIVFVDSDDCLFDKSLKNLENYIKNISNPDVVIVRFDKITFPTSNHKLISSNNKNNNSSIRLINYVTKSKFPFADCWFFVPNRKFLLKNKILFPKIRFGESELFVVKLVTLMKSFDCMKFPFYDKRDRDSSLNHSKDYSATLSTLTLILDFCIFLNKYKLSKIKKDFAMSYIQDALGIFTSLLILRTDSELKKLSNIMNKELKNLNFLKKMPENLSLLDFLKKKNSHLSLLDFRDKIIDIHYKSIKPLLNKYKYIFCYCRSKYSESTIHFLKNYNIEVHGIIDDNDKFKNSNFLNFKTLNSKTFISKYQKILNDSAVIISHQRISTSNKIIKGLKLSGLGRGQIKVIKF